MHGLGNDFMVIDCVSQPHSLSTEQIALYADRQLGIGFDQLLQIEPATRPDADFRYRIFNRDGSEVEHCGNGARCFAKYVHDKGLTTRNPVKVETVNRLLSLQLSADGEVTVDMGEPDFAPESLPFEARNASVEAVSGKRYRCEIAAATTTQKIEFSALSMGNPHAVIVVDDLDKADVAGLGAALGQHGCFPQGVNVGFMQVVAQQSIRLRVFERGSGETLACGTGACAAVVSGCKLGLLESPVEVNVRGGTL
ncbi:MAG: diaminopimelate epimerase, partial [OM182 bacterium]|nr:diaminopimelate epimerase [OM182 bacterium]